MEKGALERALAAQALRARTRSYRRLTCTFVQLMSECVGSFGSSQSSRLRAHADQPRGHTLPRWRGDEISYLFKNINSTESKASRKPSHI
jgi:hypothetical protein